MHPLWQVGPGIVISCRQATWSRLAGCPIPVFIIEIEVVAVVE
jgi:hypothetical protein